MDTKTKIMLEILALLGLIAGISTFMAIRESNELSANLDREIPFSIPAANLTVINPQSFPRVGGNWTVEFKTKGTANLTVMFSNGTTAKEIEISELKRGNESLGFLYLVEKNAEER